MSEAQERWLCGVIGLACLAGCVALAWVPGARDGCLTVVLGLLGGVAVLKAIGEAV